MSLHALLLLLSLLFPPQYTVGMHTGATASSGGGGGGTPSVDAGCKNQVHAAGTSFTATCGSMGAITATDLVAQVTGHSNGCSATTDQADDNTNSGNYTANTRLSDNDNCQQQQWFLFYNSASISAGALTWTTCTGTLSGATCSGGTSETTWVTAGIACKSCATASGIDAYQAGPALATSVTTIPATTINVTTTHANDIILGAICGAENSGALDNYGTVTVGAPYAFATGAGTGTSGCWIGYQVVSSTGTYACPTFTIQFAGTPTYSCIALKGS